VSDGPLGPDVDPAAVDGTVRELLHLLGKRHTMAILYVFARDPGPWRFGELQNRLGVSSNTLTVRLGELREAGLITRESYDEIPPRVKYTGTVKAEELKPAFRHLYEWAYRHEVGP
jgi:DNA-binding HxlR family transcriptional regulator